MKQAIVFLALFAAAHAWGEWVGGLSVKFGTNLFGIGSANFIALPRTLTEAKNQRWVDTERPDGPMSSLVLYCPSEDDRVICVLFDDNGYVVGTQIAVPIDAVSNAAFNWDDMGFTQWTPPATTAGVVRSYYTLAQYFVDEEILATPAADRLAAHNSETTLQNDNVWVTAFNKERIAISVEQTQIADTSNTHFTEQACVIFMGLHYYYNMTTTMDCTSTNLIPWFPLVHSGELIGMGFSAIAELDRTALVKDYFEAPTQSDVEMIVPRGPQCFYDLATTPGIFTMHVYFIDAPWLVFC